MNKNIKKHGYKTNARGHFFSIKSMLLTLKIYDKSNLSCILFLTVHYLYDAQASQQHYFPDFVLIFHDLFV